MAHPMRQPTAAEIAGIKKRSAAKYGHSLGKAAIMATWRRSHLKGKLPAAPATGVRPMTGRGVKPGDPAKAEMPRTGPLRLTPKPQTGREMQLAGRQPAPTGRLGFSEGNPTRLPTPPRKKRDGK